MMQLLQTLMAEKLNAERQANIAALQQIAQNNQGHGNHDHPGSKLKNFQNTNPPVFSKTEEPLDADDWLQTMENNLEVAGVEANDKVLFATHYLAGPARAWWNSARALNAGQMMTWADFKLKFSKYHVPPGLIKKMRDEFRELKQGRMTVVEYRDKFLTLSRYAPDETDTTEKRKERFLNGLHDEMQTVLVNIPFADLEALVDSAIQMEGKLNQANENRKRRMMNQSGPSNNPKFRPSSSGGFNPRNNKPPTPMSRPGYQNRSGVPGGHPNHNNHNYVHHNTNFNRAPTRAPANNPNTNTAPRTGSNAIPVATKDKATITCYECGVVGHYSNECPKRLAKLAANTAASAQQQRRVTNGKKFAPNNPNHRNSRLFHMNAEEAQDAPDVVLDRDIEFILKFIPGTGTIAQIAYSMNPAELVEMKKPLDELRPNWKLESRSSQILASNPRLPSLRHCTRSPITLANVASNLAIDRRRPTALSDPLDASNEEYPEEEDYTQEEEEENFDSYPNQGKLLPMQANTLASHPNAKLFMSKAPLHFTYA
ncbi:hypothetical protein QYE76_068616 [Lolium multiflorum]|uniref:CCHC-type domain-containing protein n=1 Tax=Lolium multiflorum TaxID=4521 RepID=A0AAD8SEQ5_LOLMU|nr:hypothetical protein QYE76_068616 [Lolium multiflorum]